MAPAKERVFTAVKGVTFQDHEAPAAWASFARDDAREDPNGPKVFSFATSDPKVAERLLADTEYGITEVTEND